MLELRAILDPQVGAADFGRLHVCYREGESWCTGWNAALCSGPSGLLLPSVSATKGSLWRSSSMSGVVSGCGKSLRNLRCRHPPESTSMEAWAPAGCRWSRGDCPLSSPSQTIRTQSASARSARCGGVEPDSVERALHHDGLVRRLHEQRMVSTRRGPLLECRWRTVGSDFPRGVWCWMTAWGETERIALPFGTPWMAPRKRPITGVGVLLPHRPSPDRDYGKFTDATPASRVVLAFFLDVGTAGCLEVATCGIAGCGLRATDGLRAARRATHPAVRALVRGGWISALDPLVPCSPPCRPRTHGNGFAVAPTGSPLLVWEG